MSGNKPAKPAVREWGGVALITLIFAIAGGIIGWVVARNSDGLTLAWAYFAYIPIGAFAGIGVGWGAVLAFVWWLEHQFDGIGGCGGY